MKKLLLTLLLCFPLLAHAGPYFEGSDKYTDFSEDANCQLVLRFEDKSGSHAIDTSGNNRHQQIYAAPIYTNDGTGPQGAFYWFDGIDDYMTANTDQFEDANFTIALWLWPDGAGAWRMPVGKYNGAGSSTWFIITDDATPENYYFAVYNDSDTEFATADVAITDNVWTHLCGTFDGTNVKIYKNGVLQDTNSSFTGSIDNNAAVFMIGDSDDGSRRWRGNMDEIIYLDDDLTAAEVLELYERGIQ